MMSVRAGWGRRVGWVRVALGGGLLTGVRRLRVCVLAGGCVLPPHRHRERVIPWEHAPWLALALPLSLSFLPPWCRMHSVL